MLNDTCHMPAMRAAGDRLDFCSPYARQCTRLTTSLEADTPSVDTSSVSQDHHEPGGEYDAHGKHAPPLPCRRMRRAYPQHQIDDLRRKCDVPGIWDMECLQVKKGHYYNDRIVTTQKQTLFS